MRTNQIQIIYLNGPSSSGKSTLAKALQQALEEPFLHVSIDDIIDWMPEKINDWNGGEAPLGFSWKSGKDESGNPIQEIQMGKYAQNIPETFQEVIVTLAKMGHSIIIDDISLGQEQIDQWRDALKDFKVLWIGVNAPLDVLEQREKVRSNRITGSARGQYYTVHLNAVYNLQIDTHYTSLNESVAQIVDRINK